MKKVKLRAVPALPALRDGYTKAVSQGLALMEGAMELAPRRAAIALALAEIGQEEVGKSLSLLAAMALPANSASMEWFWKSWTDHQTKAHRAFLYELISPTRLEMQALDGRRLAGFSLRTAIQQEREAGFYVNFDTGTGRFLSPADSVTQIEAFHRVATLLYLGVTADCVHDALEATESLGSHRLFAEIAFRICSEEIYQQEMPAILLEFSQRSASHARIVRQLHEGLAGGEQLLTKLLASSARAEGE